MKPLTKTQLAEFRERCISNQRGELKHGKQCGKLLDILQSKLTSTEDRATKAEAVALEAVLKVNELEAKLKIAEEAMNSAAEVLNGTTIYTGVKARDILTDVLAKIRT